MQSASGSRAENLFIQLFTETFGVEKTGYLYTQYPFCDIYQNNRFADFVMASGVKKIAIEIDDEASHNPRLVSQDKFCDDLLKQNSMIYLGWDVFRWTVRQIQKQPDSVKDELRLFIGNSPQLKAIDDYLPEQRGKTLDGNNLELRSYQEEALIILQQMRRNKETIALLCQATGTGKTLVAVKDAQSLGGRVLFVAHTIDLVNQAYQTFVQFYPEKEIGLYVDGNKEVKHQVVCGSVQSVALNLDSFGESDFDYLIIDEAHHATAETYQKILSYFKPKFTLGLTATPERTDDVNILDVFKKTAHKLDIQTAVDLGALVPVRCIRIHTNIDMTKVRFNSIQYNIRDLDVKLCVVERNEIIVKTWLDFVRGKRTVVFCVSVKHANIVAELFRQNGINAAAVSGEMKTSERSSCLKRFRSGKLEVLCACDLLNEGWDCPETEVLFMARPTMSKLLYTQQLGRGMRPCPGKEFLLVFDFVDNASQFNAPYSLHRLFKLNEYRPGELVLAQKGAKEAERELYDRGEKPDAIIDFPVYATDFELVDIFNWQEKAAKMVSQIEFVRRVNVQSETIERFVQSGRLIPDMVVPMSEYRQLKYFTEENLKNSSARFGWQLIDDRNRKNYFMEIVRQMDMSYSYKPVLLKAFFRHANKKGQVKIADLVNYFKAYYKRRKENGLTVEKKNSIYTKETYTDKEVERNILINPFKRFEDMNILSHTKTIGIIAMNDIVWRHLDDFDKNEIEQICNKKLEQYYNQISKGK